MKIFVAGASGRVGRLLVQDLADAGHQVDAGSRHPEIFADSAGVAAVECDLHADVTQLRTLISGADAVYFVAGSRGKDLLQTDAFGAVKLMQAAEAEGIHRFILLSSIFADEPEKWSDPALIGIMNYNIAKFFADQWLINNTNLNYTILQPGSLTEEAGTGQVTFTLNHSVPNTIPDVAQVLAQLLEADNTYGKIIMMGNGDTNIAQAIANV